MARAVARSSTARRVVTEAPRGSRPDIEEWLAGWAAAWTLHESVRNDSFDVERSLRNQARLGAPVDQEYVDRYASAMRDGAIFPAVVAWRDDKTAKLVIIDGNHRMMAARDAGYELAAYIVKDATPQALTAMTFEANVTHGKSTSEEERIHHALWLADNGMAMAEAAKRMAVPKAKVTKANLEQESGRRADLVGINRRDWDSLSVTTRNRLAMIHTDEGFRAGAQLVLDAGLSYGEVTELVATVNDSRSGQRQAGAVATMRKGMTERLQEVRTTGGPTTKRSRSPKSALAAGLGILGSLPPDETIVESLSDPERDDMRQRIDPVLARLRTLRAALR